MTGHDPKRPEWMCDTCPPATEWPCSPAKVRLGERYRDSLGLAMHMRYMLDLAAKDLADLDPRLNPSQLHERFIGWTRPERPR